MTTTLPITTKLSTGEQRRCSVGRLSQKNQTSSQVQCGEHEDEDPQDIDYAIPPRTDTKLFIFRKQQAFTLSSVPKAQKYY